MKLLEKIELSKLIIEHAVLKYPKIFTACSFGKDSRVLIDLILPIKPNFEFIFIDTGFEFPETLAFAEKLVKETRMRLKTVRPSKADIKRLNKSYRNSFIKKGQYKCCAMKIPAVERILPKYDAWITGLRRDETKYRKSTRLIEDGKIIKINPIAFWKCEEVWEYIKRNRLDYHPLYNKGYTSLGCKPCTTRGKIQKGGGRQGRFERAGRFVGTKNRGEECGLHTM